jgi:hypothetical protein
LAEPTPSPSDLIVAGFAASVTNEDYIVVSRIEELDIVIRRKDGRVTAGIPQLALYVTADDVRAAITDLEQKRTALFGDLAKDIELEDIDVRPYRGRWLQRPTEGGIGQFALKAAIVIGLIAGTAVISAALLLPKIERIIVNAQARVQQLTKFGGHEFWTKAERELARAAEPTSDLTPEQRRRILSQINVIVERWRPFIAEIAPLFVDLQRPTAHPTSQEGK